MRPQAEINRKQEKNVFFFVTTALFRVVPVSNKGSSELRLIATLATMLILYKDNQEELPTKGWGNNLIIIALEERF